MRNHVPAPADHVRVVVIGEQELYRKGLCLLLSQRDSLKVVGDSDAPAEALSLVRREHPDVVLLTINSKGSPGVDFLPDILCLLCVGPTQSS